MSLHQERNPTTVSHLLTQIQEQENFRILRRRAALERPAFRVPEECLAANVDCPLVHAFLWVLQETFESLPAREGPSCISFNNSKNLASSSEELRPEVTGTSRRQEGVMKREPLNTSIPLPHFQRGGAMLNHTGGNYSHSGMIDYPRLPISELHLWEHCLTLWIF